MAYIGFNCNGYEYFDKENYIMFSSDNTHNHLFEYADKDLSRLPLLFEQYISKKMDITNLELKEYRNNDEEIAAIRDILASAHPYYEIEYKKVIIDAIGTYFNTLLVYLVYRKNRIISIPASQNEQEKDWYIKKITHLMPSSLTKKSLYPDGSYPADFYNAYTKWLGDYAGTEIEESFIINIPSKEPLGFYKEIYTQKTICNMLYFILDISAKNMYSLTLPQRIWLYNNIFNTMRSQPFISAEHHFLFQPPTQYSAGDNCNERKSCNNMMYDKFEPLFSFRELNLYHDEIPTNMMDSFMSAINFAKEITDSGIYEEYEVNDISQLLHLEVLFMINSKIVIKKCKNCGKYFVVNDRKKAYCDRVYESGKTCSAIGSKRSFQKKMEKEPALNLYNRAYKTHHARIRNKKMSMENFSIWSKEAKEKLDDVRSGKLDIEAFQKWLKI